MILPLAFAAALMDGPRDLELAVRGSSLFKNGYAVVLREAKIPSSGEYYIRDIPQAGLGTFWLMTSPGTHLEFFKNEDNETTTDRNAASIDELLGLNVGKMVEVSVYSGATPVTYKAKIVSTDGAMVLLQTGNEVQAINKANIQSLRSVDALVYKTKNVTNSRVLHLKVVAGEGATIKLMTLEKGLSWSPSYYVDISDPKNLSVVAKATLIDDLGDIKDAAIRLVTGFPNFQHASSADPMSFFQVVLQSTNYLSNNVAFGQGQYAGGLGGGAGDRREVQSVADAFAGGALPGGSNEDLFYYDLPHVSLKKTDRAYQPLFDGKSEYEHVYKLTIDETRTSEANPSQNRPPLEVWHTLEFKNPMSQPLTTAPAIVVSHGEVLGQSTIDYTPVSAKVCLNLTKALDIPADIHEEELSRKRIQLTDRWVDEVLVKGRIRIENRKGGPIHLEVIKDLVGEVREINEGGVVEKSSQGLAAINSRSNLKWDAHMESYKTLDLTYTYMVRL